MRDKKLAIFAGRGLLPKMLIENCQKNRRQFLLFLLESEEYEIDYSAFNPIKVPYGNVGEFLEILEKNNVKDIVFIGAVNKPNFSNIKVDKKGAILLAKILASKILGDDAVLKTVIKFFEKEGFRIAKIDEFLDGIISKKCALTRVQPDTQNLLDIDFARKAINTMSPFDIGQSVIVAQKQIIAVEAVEGTDSMISRVGGLKIDFKKDAILIKMKKQNQSKKADLPVIGIETIKNCIANNVCGIAIEAGVTLIINREEVVKLANEAGMFIVVI